MAGGPTPAPSVSRSPSHARSAPTLIRTAYGDSSGNTYLTKLIKPVYIQVRDPRNSRDSRWRRTDSSAYEIPIQEFKSMLLSLSESIRYV